MLHYYDFMLITQRNQIPLSQYLQFIEQCVLGGVTSVQLREKDYSTEEKLSFALELKQLLAPYGVPLIINDDLPLALKVDANGVHLGQDDIKLYPVNQAREELGPTKIIGLSVQTEEQFKIAQTLPIDYMAASATFNTSTKNIKTTWGLAGLQYLSSHSEVPIIAIGGINEFNILSVLEHGASGIALISYLHNSDSPKELSKNIKNILMDWRKND